MPPANDPAVVLAIAHSAAIWAGAPLAGMPDLAGAWSGVWAFLSTAAQQARALLEAGYARAPALVAVLLAALALPALALACQVVRAARHRRMRRVAARVASRHADGVGPAAETTLAPERAPLWPRQAWLTLEGSAGETLPLAGELIRIGRHHDNDIRLPDASVHRHHALIEHTPQEAFVIVDLSGKGGNGVRINGQRCARVELSDGDVIELGRTRLRFESAPV